MKVILNNTKRIIAVLFCILITEGVFAHERDSLKCSFDESSVYTYILYTATNGGYICGNNGDGDLEIAQKFGQSAPGDTVGTECSVPDEHQLFEVSVWFGGKKVSNPNDTVYLNVYSINPVTGGPGALLGSTYSVKLNFVDTSTVNLPIPMTDFLLQTPIAFTDSFFVSIVLPQGSGDTLGVISNTDPQGQSSKLCWVKGSSGNWSTVAAAHGLDIDIVLFPEVGDVESVIEEASLLIKGVNAYPNPAKGNTIIEYSLVSTLQQLDFKLTDYTGRLVYSRALENNTAGKHILNVSTADLPSGSYFYSFESEGVKSNGKLAVSR